MNNSIAHLKRVYLPLSETFIFEQIKNIKTFDSVVIQGKPRI